MKWLLLVASLFSSFTVFAEEDLVAQAQDYLEQQRNSQQVGMVSTPPSDTLCPLARAAGKGVFPNSSESTRGKSTSANEG